MTNENAINILRHLIPPRTSKAAFDAFRQAIEMAIEALEEPKIIRCKNCKYWIPYDWMFSEVWQSKNIADYSENEIGCKYCDMSMKANDFCSRAERREVTK